MSGFLIWISNYMGKEFERLSLSGEKVGEQSSNKAAFIELAKTQTEVDDTSCGVEEEGHQSGDEGQLSPTSSAATSLLKKKSDSV
jgi:hypothetical protein